MEKSLEALDDLQSGDNPGKPWRVEKPMVQLLLIDEEVGPVHLAQPCRIIDDT